MERTRTLLCTLVLTFAPAATSAQGHPSVSARVVDAITRRPLAAAAVTAGRAFTLTVEDGHFALQLPDGAERLTVERVGYAPAAFEAGAVPAVIGLEPDPYLLERLAVTVDRGHRLAAGTALAADARERVELDVRAGTSIAELLESMQGVATSRVGSWGSRPVIRGLSGERIAVQVDGSRVNRACTFGMDQGLASIDPAVVERVELLTGPGSALYGSGSVGGVINVVTRRPLAREGISGEIRGGASSAVPGGSLGGQLHLVRGTVGASLALDGASYGDYRTPSATVAGSSYRHLTADAKVEFRPAPVHLLSFKGQRYEGRDIGWPMMMGASIPEETRTGLSVDYGWQLGRDVLDGLSLRVHSQRLDHHMIVDALMQGPMGPMTSRADATSYSSTQGARAQVRLAPSAGLRAEAGTEWTRWFAEGTRWTESSSGSMPPKTATFRTWPAVTINDLGAFLQAEADLGRRLTLSAGARLDRVARDAEGRPSSKETVATGNLGIRANLGSGFSLRSTFGIGYRNPDPMELFGLALKPDGFVYRGSPDLETERSRNVEGSLGWEGARGGLSVTAYRNRLEDMIAPVLVPGETEAGRPVRAYTALGAGVLSGVSLSASLVLADGLSLRVSADRLHGEDADTGEPLVAMAPASVDAVLRRDFGGAALRWVEVALEGADAQDRVSTSAGELPTPGYGAVHLRSGVEVAGARLTLGVENLFDRGYRTHLDPARLLRPGRNLFVRVARGF